MLDGSKTIRDVPADVERILPEDERQWLEGLAVRLIVPIAGTRDQLVGVLLLGERKSEEPSSATDRRLLQGLATQIGLVYENQHLQQRVRRDADVRRDVLARLDDRSITLLKECPACGRCYDSTSERCEQDGRELVLTLPIERTLDGKYRLDRALGRGGFGAVYKACGLAAATPGRGQGDDGIALRQSDRAAAIRARGARGGEDRSPAHHARPRLRDGGLGRRVPDHGAGRGLHVARGVAAERRHRAGAGGGVVSSIAQWLAVRARHGGCASRPEARERDGGLYCRECGDRGGEDHGLRARQGARCRNRRNRIGNR